MDIYHIVQYNIERKRHHINICDEEDSHQIIIIKRPGPKPRQGAGWMPHPAWTLDGSNGNLNHIAQVNWLEAITYKNKSDAILSQNALPKWLISCNYN